MTWSVFPYAYVSKSSMRDFSWRGSLGTFAGPTLRDWVPAEHREFPAASNASALEAETTGTDSARPAKPSTRLALVPLQGLAAQTLVMSF